MGALVAVAVAICVLGWLVYVHMLWWLAWLNLADCSASIWRILSSSISAVVAIPLLISSTFSAPCPSTFSLLSWLSSWRGRQSYGKVSRDPAEAYLLYS